MRAFKKTFSRPRTTSPRTPRRQSSNEERHAKDTGSTSWERHASWYEKTVEDRGSYQRAVILPRIMTILDLKGAESILDIGSGSGLFSYEMARKAAQVDAVELSPTMVSQAKKKYARQKNLTFTVGDAQRLEARGLYDIVTMIMMIQNVEHLDRALRSAAARMKKGGRIMIVMNHPVLRVPRQSQWGWDEQKKLQYRRIDRYLSQEKIPITMHPGKSKEVTWSFHRPLQDYITTLHASGIAVIGLEEWTSHKESTRGGHAKAENRAREEFPLFMTIVGRKD